MELGRYKHKITEKEFKSATNVCKRLAREYYDSRKASFIRLIYICCEQDLAMMINTIDKKYNQNKR